MKEGSVVTSAVVEGTQTTEEPTYAVDDGAPTEFLGREATLYRLLSAGMVRAELVVDDELGALLSVVTYAADKTVYCARRFIEFDPTPPQVPTTTLAAGETLEPTKSNLALPETLGGFERLDMYEDKDGFVFAYYSDGFFSFAVFQTPTVVELADPGILAIGQALYARSFSPGQVTYSWETRSGGMALVGDLPPDMHPEVLKGLAKPFAPGILQRVWRNLFG